MREFYAHSDHDRRDHIDHDRPSDQDHLAEMSDLGVRGTLIYCADHRCTVFELMQQCGWRILPPKDEQTACCGG